MLDDGWGDDAIDEMEHGEMAFSSHVADEKVGGFNLRDVVSFLDRQTLANKQQELITQTADLLFVSAEEASCLLRHYQWKKGRLQEEWFAMQDKVRSSVGVTRLLDRRSDPQHSVQCSTAYCDKVPIEDALALNCGHWFCHECWRQHLESEINAGRKCVFATCPGMKCRKDHFHKFGCACNEMVPRQVFQRLVSSAPLTAKYDGWMLDNFVEGQRHIKWCPNPKCELALHCTTNSGALAVTCRCGTSSCFGCGKEAHTPAPCDLVAKWKQREVSDDATQIWLDARTKECPKCKVRIEKNRACNHMTCAKCRHDFCWLCKGNTAIELR